MEIRKMFLPNLFFALFGLLFLTSCENSETHLKQEKTYIVASKKINCQGESIQSCYLIKEKKEDTWTSFYSEFANFKYEEGFEYVLLISEEEIENPPQDASSIAYTLIRVISKTEKTSENLPK